MIPDPAYIKQLFIKQAHGTATAEETALLVSYLQQGGNEEALPTPEEMLLEMPDNRAMQPVATERVLQNILATTATTSRPPHRIKKLWWTTAAAAVLITAIALLYHPAPAPPLLVSSSTGFGEIRQLTLPDGSSVTLNANTSLQYDSIHWHTAKKEVWVTGEAFFDIVPHPAAEFTVHAGKELAVQVLGTRFSVVTNIKQVRVVLNSGKVKVNISNPKQPATALVLQPGEMAAYNNTSGLLTRQPADTLQLTSWKNNQFTFRETSLEEIAGQITTQFGVKVNFASPQLAQLRFTGTTPANDLDVMLAILRKSLDIRIDKYNNQVMINLAR